MDTGVRLASVTPLKAIVGIGYSRESWAANLDWIGVKVASDKSTASFKASGYGVVNLTGWWERLTPRVDD
jgi:hemoglobin/transferrin/lactoferrin receptor protein